MGKAARKLKLEPQPLKLDFGCGPHSREGFEGVDKTRFDGVKHILDLAAPIRWPWADNSVSEGHASHFVEHLTAMQRCHFFNELYRVLVPNGTCFIVTPHWASNRAYGDPTHQWPPVSEMTFLYLWREWRLANAPHTDAEHLKGGYSCDFDFTQGYNVRQDVMTRNPEAQQFALQNYKEVCQDQLTTVTKAVRVKKNG